MIVCATPACDEPSTTDAHGLCSRCSRRPIKVKGEKLCGACYMRALRYADALEEEKRKRPDLRRHPWERLEQAAKRYTRAMDLGWTDRAIASAREQLSRAAEGYRRSRKKPRRNARAIRGNRAATGMDGCPETSEAKEIA